MPEHFGEARDAEDVSTRVHVLPAEQEPHQIRRGDWLDLAAQPPEREPVDARKQRPFAPLEPARTRSEAATEKHALRLQGGQLDLGDRKPQPAGELRGRERPHARDPSAHHLEEIGPRPVG